MKYKKGMEVKYTDEHGDVKSAKVEYTTTGCLKLDNGKMIQKREVVSKWQLEENLNILK